MTIKAILRDGKVHLLEPLPPAWSDGQELVIEEPESDVVTVEVERWAKDLEAFTARIPAEENSLIEHALAQIEQESKDVIRREWGLE